MFGFNPVGTLEVPLEVQFPTENRQCLSTSLALHEDVYPSDDHHSDLVVEYMLKRRQVQEKALERSDWYKDRAAQFHDLGVRAPCEYNPADLVMLYDHQQAGKKLRPIWRGPFVVTGLGEDMGKSYSLRQVYGTPIPRSYYGDSLKRFRLREGYLVTREEEGLPVFQNTRLGRSAFRLPKNLRTVPGAYGTL